MKTKTARRWLNKNVWLLAKARLGFFTGKKLKNILKMEKFCKEIIK